MVTFQLCCGEGRTLQTNITGICGECLQYLGHTGFAPAHCVCAFPVYTAQALGCSARNCLRLASTRHPVHVIELAKAGADVATVPFKVIMQMIDHPLTKSGLEKFMKDWATIPQ